jgi:hypothetical protein
MSVIGTLIAGLSIALPSRNFPGGGMQGSAAAEVKRQ